MAPYERWTRDEHERFMRMVAAGKSRAEIARAVRRSVHSVQSRITEYRLLTAPRKETEPPPRMVVAKHDVPDWYALGWRFVGFEHGTIVMEWGNDREPLWPADQRREAA